MSKQRLVVGISGSSGAVLGIRLLQALRATPVEAHLVVTPSARLTIQHETQWSVEDVQNLARVYYDPQDLAAPIASGSFDTIGMVVIPCSIKSLSAIANSYSAGLLARAADVTLKEGRPLLLVVREAPLHAGHLDLMQRAARSGAILFPPVPAFYTYPQSVDEIVDNIVGRVLRRIGIANDLYEKWGEKEASQSKETLAPEKGKARRAGGELGAEEFWDAPVMVLATVGEDGAPHTTTVPFAADNGRRSLYFFSEPGSQLNRDLLINPRAAVSIQPAQAHGLELRGTAQIVSAGEEWERAQVLYLVKFPITEGQNDPVTGRALYAFRPN
jgi:4-hydroxy-3-polyprenylbenzoate decarboxylase